MVCFCTRANTSRCRGPAEKRTDRNQRLQPGRHDHPTDLLPLTLTILIQGQHSDAAIRAAVWGRSLFDKGDGLVEVAEPTQQSTRAAGPGDSGHRHDGAPYIERRHDALPREPLRRLFPVASALSTMHRRCEIGEMRTAERRRIVDTLMQACSPNLWDMGGSDRREFCVSVIRFACSLADLLKSVSNHTRPRADVRPGLLASVLNAPL
jgi:hypothetical protein